MSMPLDRPWSEACERNKGPILQVLRGHLGDGTRVLEVGSGTGQHAVHFAAALPGITWLTSDLAANHHGIRRWIETAGAPNVELPVVLDTRETRWPVTPPLDAIFSANTAHIMHLDAVRGLFLGAGRVLAAGGLLLLYGPFSYGGRHVSESNARFDASLRAQDPDMGVRDVDELNVLAAEAGLEPVADHAMPSNNRVLVWRRSG